MKKIIFSLALLFCMCIGATAQTKVSFNGPIGMDWKFKRSFMHGNTLVVDFVVENNTSQDIGCTITKSGSGAKGSYEIKAYDDEGNVYSEPWYGGSTNFEGKIGGKNSLYEGETIPRGNLIKVRLQIPGIDEYATLIKTLTIPIYHSKYGGLDADVAELRVTNIPSPRE